MQSEDSQSKPGSQAPRLSPNILISNPLKNGSAGRWNRLKWFSIICFFVTSILLYLHVEGILPLSKFTTFTTREEPTKSNDNTLTQELSKLQDLPAERKEEVAPPKPIVITPPSPELEKEETALLKAYENEVYQRAVIILKETPLTNPFLASANRPYQNSLGMRFVPIPVNDTKRPILMSVWETRNADFAAFEKLHPHVKHSRKVVSEELKGIENRDYPVVNVSWEHAQAFCDWLTTKESRFGVIPAGAYYRLPTDHEWSQAVGIGDVEDAEFPPILKNGKIKDLFPWGGSFPPSEPVGNYADEIAKQKFPDWKHIKNYEDGYAVTAPVGSYAPNHLGIHDLGGNVWEWCEDIFDPRSPNNKVIRGGAWDFSMKHTLFSSFRGSARKESSDEFTGFRVVLQLEKEMETTSTSP